MIRKTSIRQLPVFVLLAFVLTSCASTGNHAMKDGSDTTSQEIVYEVKPGDSLSSIGKSLTGLYESWEVIAVYNEITDPKSLAVGQTIKIPGTLIKPVRPLPPRARASFINKTAASIANPSTRMGVTKANGVNTVHGTSAQFDDFAPITMYSVEVNRSFTLEPIDPTLALKGDQRTFGSEAPQIKVSGTYYPKGIYEEPANYARLIRRAAPGTRFTLEQEVNNWYKITTDEGVGYIRQSDSKLVD